MFKLGFSTKPLTLEQRGHVYHKPQHQQLAKYRLIIKKSHYVLNTRKKEEKNVEFHRQLYIFLHSFPLP